MMLKTFSNLSAFCIENQSNNLSDRTANGRPFRGNCFFAFGSCTQREECCSVNKVILSMNEPMILAAISVLSQGNNLKLETRDVDHLELWINS